MENLSHSLHPSKLSKKAAHANAAPKGIYDDVFGGPPKFGVPTLSPRIEDYSEIFGGFHAPRASSIPVLDLPVVDEPEAFCDVRSPEFDYSEVFGGFNGLDFADGFEDLVVGLCGGSVCGSSEEAWTPAASECLSEETDNFGSNQCLSNGDSHHSFDENIEYNISYHKTNLRGSADMSNGLRHASQIHAVPGFSYFVDQMNPSLARDDVAPFDQQRDDYSGRNLNSDWEMKKKKHVRKAKSTNFNGSVSGQAHTNDIGCQRGYSRTNSCPDPGFVTISEVSLRTAPSHLPPPSRPPPALDIKRGDASGSCSSRKTASPEGTDGDSSPPFFDVEVDGSSSAAAVASAAAMKEVMVKARAQLRSAKELMNRKKDSFQNRTKLGVTSDSRETDRKHRKDAMGQGISHKETSGAKIPMETESLVHENETKFVKTPAEVLSLPKMVTEFEEAGEWKEVTQYFELVTNDRSGADLDETEKEENLSGCLRNRGNGLKEVKVGAEVCGRVENHRKKGAQETTVVKAKEPKEGCKAEIKSGKPKATKEAFIQTDLVKKDKAPQVMGEQEKADQTNHKQTVNKISSTGFSDFRGNLDGAQIDVIEFEPGQVMSQKKDEQSLKELSKRIMNEGIINEGPGNDSKEKKQKKTPRRDEKEVLQTVSGQTEGEKRQHKMSKQNETEVRLKVNPHAASKDNTEREHENLLKETLEQDENEKKLKEIIELEERKKIKEAREREEHERRLKMNLELAEKKKKVEDAEREEKDNRLKEVLEREDSEKRLKEVHMQEEVDKSREACEREESQRKQREALERREKERHKEVLQKEEERRQKEALQLVEKEKKQKEEERRQKEAFELIEKEKKQKETLEKEEKEKMLKQKEEEQRQKEAFELIEKEKKQKETLEKEEKEKTLKEALEQEENKKRLDAAYRREERTKRLEEVCELDENGKRAREAYERECTGEVPQEHLCKEKNEKNLKDEPGIECDNRNSKGAQAYEDIAKSEQEYEQEEINDALKETFELEQIGIELNEGISIGKLVSSNESHNDEACRQKSNRDNQSDFLAVGCEKCTVASFSDKNDSSGSWQSVAVETEKPIDRQREMSGFTGVERENEKDRSKTGDSVPPPPSDNPVKIAPGAGIGIGVAKIETINQTLHQAEKCVQEQEEKKNTGQPEDGVDVDRRKEKFVSSQPVNEGFDKGKRTEIPQPAAKNIQSSLQPEISTEAEVRKEKNINKPVASDEKDAGRVSREQELEKDRLRKIEEEREREREREKDRMAVDRATLEARERAFAEARERAERTAVERAAEVRQRSLNEARERLEKACAEARERSFLDKASMEAKVKAECAAVERAMAEARERAAEKTAYEGRERVDRSTSENFSASRHNGMRQTSLPSDLRSSQNQNAGSSNTLRHQYSSGYGAEKSEGESAQRYKARVERQRRTSERTAKALAEKNMRDLLAQREQAERNRLAESLDAEVRRWSSGKEGNLRALLSTLQYILGPDSGWLPIPLTEVITSTAVKKAYRKATLCVHPDKLQQRGASIQQKYICEKVFDLLKEAWNKFNSEER